MKKGSKVPFFVIEKERKHEGKTRLGLLVECFLEEIKRNKDFDDLKL